MQNLVLVQADELRQLIRDELASSIPAASNPQKPIEKPKTQKELCEFLGLSEPTVITWRDKGKIPYMKIGSVYRYDFDAVLKALEGINNKKRS